MLMLMIMIAIPPLFVTKPVNGMFFIFSFSNCDLSRPKWKCRYFCPYNIFIANCFIVFIDKMCSFALIAYSLRTSTNCYFFERTHVVVVVTVERLLLKNLFLPANFGNIFPKNEQRDRE